MIPYFLGEASRGAYLLLNQQEGCLFEGAACISKIYFSSKIQVSMLEVKSNNKNA